MLKKEFPIKTKYFSRIKSNFILQEIFSFFNITELFKFTNINTQIRSMIYQQYLTIIFSKFLHIMEILQITKFSDILFITNYNKFFIQLQTYLLNLPCFPSVEIFMKMFIIFNLKLYGVKDNYKDQRICLKNSKLTIYKCGYYCHEDLFSAFISIKKVERIHDKFNVICNLIHKLDVKELIVSNKYIDEIMIVRGVKEDIYKMNNLISLGVLEINEKGLDHFKLNFNITKIKLTRRVNYENLYEEYIKASTIIDYFPNLEEICLNDFEYNAEGEEYINFIEFINELHYTNKIFKKIKLKNFVNVSFDNIQYKSDSESNDSHDNYDDQEEEKMVKNKRPFNYQIDEIRVNTKTFKIVGGYITCNSFSKFLNVNCHIEKLVLKDVEMSENDFIDLLENISHNSNIQVIKTSLEYSDKVYEALNQINYSLKRNIKLFCYNN